MLKVTELIAMGEACRNDALEEAAKVCDTLAGNGRKGNTQAGRHAAGALDMAAYKIRKLKVQQLQPSAASSSPTEMNK
jgi:hypothetical protein